MGRTPSPKLFNMPGALGSSQGSGVVTQSQAPASGAVGATPYVPPPIQQSPVPDAGTPGAQPTAMPTPTRPPMQGYGLGNRFNRRGNSRALGLDDQEAMFGGFSY